MRAHVRAVIEAIVWPAFVACHLLARIATRPSDGDLTRPR
jgi:hypothetical protein